ncbi:VOC family protein [Phycicoccus sp. MAQZ13P-2]|uniref:VOC family protein n=1 Tax=Phycicoccus TaxID=367298 RepID=UPI0004C3E2BD|nr:MULTISPECIES: VOC family protein [Phycicoccus]MBT9255473.1 VOC family protein [Phycicoccus mangrovi]MBT9273497.1 VOC family protein [Phycicoccus mangrovi]
MRVDHVVYAAEHDGVHATAERLAKLIGVEPVDGGVHPRFGTRNVILPLAHERYVEVVEVLDHPASDKAPFGQVVRARSQAGGGWLGWVVRVDDIAEQEQRLGREAVNGNRHRPDGVELRWRQLGVKGLQADPQLPFFITWEEGTPHPSEDADTEVTIESLTIAGDPDRVRDWLGLPADYTSSVIEFSFVAPHGTPGLMAVTFDTPQGEVVV